MQLLKGAPVAAAIRDEIKNELEGWESKPCLAIVRVGEKEEDLSYERSAIKRMNGVGIETKLFSFPADISMEAFSKKFASINADPSVDGILLFRPLPSQLDEAAIVESIAPEKDVDGISSLALGKLFSGDKSAFAPCTAQAVMEILHFYGIEPQGKRAVVLGRSLVVGKPLSMLLLNENATVTICHSRTVSLPEVCREADILVTAIGKAKWVDERFVSENSIVIDVGINVDENGKLCGDVNFGQIEEKVLMATPVPGGVGAVTTAVLAKHVFEAAKRRRAANSKGGTNGLSAD